MNYNNSYLVRVKGFEPTDMYDDWLKRFHWATPDETHLAELMQEAYFNRARAEELGKQARLDVIEKFSNKVVAGRIIERLKVIEKKIKEREEQGIKEDPPLGIAFQWYVLDFLFLECMPYIFLFLEVFE